MDLKRRFRWFALLAVTTAISGCGGGGGAVNGAQADLAQARLQWARKGVRSYRYTLQLLCFCFLPPDSLVVIEVRNGVPVSKTTTTGAAVDPNTYSNLDTVEKLFADIQSTVDIKGSVVKAAYDPALGYPVNASLDPIPMAIDDEHTLTVTNFQAL